jgi:enoyl-CoA hydratase/carnithine racemase
MTATRPSKLCLATGRSVPTSQYDPGVPPVLYSSSDRIGVITLNRPEARNAVDRALALGLEAAVDRLEGDPDVWVGVLAANTAEQTSPVFCAGADLKVIQETGSAATLDTERGGFAGFVYRERTKPIVVAVDGLATAGGLEIVLAADVVVATSRSAFGLAEVRHNLIAAAGGLFRLPRAIGRGPAMAAILTGEPIDARRAFGLGLVSRLVEPGTEVLDEALRVARQIVSAAPLAVQASRRVVLSADHESDDTLRKVSSKLLEELLASQDAHEGLAAFAEKRAPQWQGR